MNSKLIFILLLTLTIGILIGYYLKQPVLRNLLYPTIYNFPLDENNSFKLSSHIQLIDLNKTIDESFNCIKTKVLFDLFQTTICLHDFSKDIYVSQTINSQKIWEESLLTKILRILLKNPEYSKNRRIVFTIK